MKSRKSSLAAADDSHDYEPPRNFSVRSAMQTRPGHPKACSCLGWLCQVYQVWTILHNCPDLPLRSSAPIRG